MSRDASEGLPPSGTKRWLTAILLVAVGVRVWGLFFGLPLDLRPDERFYQQVVSEMTAQGDLNPRLFAYPGLPFMLLLGSLRTAHGVAGMTGAAIGELPFADAVRDVAWVTRVQRVLSAALGSLTVLLVFFLARRLDGPRAGLGAAALLAVCPLHVLHSHFGVVDVPAAFFVTAALLAITAARDGGRGRFLLAGLLAGLATAMRYLPAVLALSILVVCLEARRREARPQWWLAFDVRLALAALAMIGGFLLGAPYTLLDFEGFRAGFLAPFVEGDIGLGQRSALETFETYAGIALRHGLTLPVLAVVVSGVAYVLLRPGKGRLALLLFVVLYGSLLLTARKVFFRYLIPLVPVLLVLAAGSLVVVQTWLDRQRRGLGVLLLLALLVLPTSLVVGSNRLLARPSSFETLRGWLESPEASQHPVAYTSEVVAEIVNLPGSVVRLDPAVLRAAGEPFWLVAARHAHPAIVAPEGPLTLLPENARPVRSQDVGDHQSEVFEVRDRWFHPYWQVWSIDRHGPAWSAWLVDPKTWPKNATSVPRASALHVTALAGDLEVKWQCEAPEDPVGWAVRHITPAEAGRRQAAGRTDLSDLPRVVVAGGERRAVITAPGPGDWLVIVSALGTHGEGVLALASPITMPPK